LFYSKIKRLELQKDIASKASRVTKIASMAKAENFPKEKLESQRSARSTREHIVAFVSKTKRSYLLQLEFEKNTRVQVKKRGAQASCIHCTFS